MRSHQHVALQCRVHGLRIIDSLRSNRLAKLGYTMASIRVTTLNPIPFF